MEREGLGQDVIVVGAGMAGLVAGVEAAGAGARVTILDKLGPMSARALGKLYRPGGVANDTTRSGGGGLLRFSRNAPIDELVKAHQERGWGRIDAELIRAYLRRVVADCKWLKGELGMPFQGSRVRGRGPGICPVLYKIAEKRGARLLFKTRALKLLTEGPRVTGVKARGPGGEAELRARGVVLATGGFQGNHEMMLKYVGPEITEDLPLTGSPNNTGDGHLMAMEAGAQMVNLSLCHIRTTDKFFGIGPSRHLLNIYPMGIYLNLRGQRFIDEGAADSDAIANAIVHQPGRRAALIFDDKARAQYPREYETYPAKDQVILKADSLEELAVKIEMSPELLKKAVAGFNAAVKDGQALALTIPKTCQAYTIDKAPFYGFYPVLPALNHSLGGLKINTRAQVLDRDNMPIPGLYAAGALVNWAFGKPYEVSGVKTFKGSYHAGMTGGLSTALVFGRIAGRGASGEVAAP